MLRDGPVRVRGMQAACIACGTMKFVASTCSEQVAGQKVLFEPPKSDLPAALLASPCLVQVVRDTAYVPVVNVGVTDILLYLCISLGLLSSAQVSSLPSGVSEVRPTIATMSLQVAATLTESVDLSALSELEQGEVKCLLLLMTMTWVVQT